MALKAEQPPPIQENPYFPPGPEPLIFEGFGGINTATSRPGVDDKQMAWCDGFIPLAPRFARTLYGVGDPIWTAPTTISFYKFANIGVNPVMIAFLVDGSIYQVNTETMVETQIAPAGTILSPSTSNVGMTQWGSQYILIVADQTNGYFIWDGTALFSPGGISPIVTIVSSGSGYTSAPTVSASGGSGSGIAFQAIIGAGGDVTAVNVISPGVNYLPGDVITLTFSGGGGSGADATVELMPFGISGTGIETYQGRVWIIDGPILTWSAPGSFIDFSTANGGGANTSSDSFLRVKYTDLYQANGFLYVVADSSVNYIGNVQTGGTPITTTFQNQNADPEIGSPWPASVGTFGRSIVFANSSGIYSLYGAQVQKVSEMLDGVWNSADNFGGLEPSSAKAIIFGKRVWMTLVVVIDPISGQQINKLFMFNGRAWWTSQQDVDLIYISHQEINSDLTAYGTDGTSVYPLFQRPSSELVKTIQSKLWTAPGGYQFTKAATRLWAIVAYYSLTGLGMTVSIDSEKGASPQDVTFSPAVATWINVFGNPVSWTNVSAQAVIWFVSSNAIAVMAPTAVAQQGVLTGMTITTQADDMALISIMVGDTIVQYRG